MLLYNRQMSKSEEITGIAILCVLLLVPIAGASYSFDGVPYTDKLDLVAHGTLKGGVYLGRARSLTSRRAQERLTCRAMSSGLGCTLAFGVAPSDTKAGYTQHLMDTSSVKPTCAVRMMTIPMYIALVTVSIGSITM